MSSAADQLDAIEAQMARYAAIHERSMWAWKRLRLKRDAMRLVVEIENRKLDKRAKKWCGPGTRVSDA